MIVQNPLVSALPALLTSFWVPTAVTANRIRWRRHYGKFPLRYGNYKVTRGNECDRVHAHSVLCWICVWMEYISAIVSVSVVCSLLYDCIEAPVNYNLVMVMLRESSAPPALVYICICATNPGTANANKLCIG